jgi:hypothetical protein
MLVPDMMASAASELMPAGNAVPAGHGEVYKEN